MDQEMTEQSTPAGAGGSANAAAGRSASIAMAQGLGIKEQLARVKAAAAAARLNGTASPLVETPVPDGKRRKTVSK